MCGGHIGHEDSTRRCQAVDHKVKGFGAGEEGWIENAHMLSKHIR